MATNTKCVLIEFQDESYQVSFQSAAQGSGPSDLARLREATALAGIFQAEPHQITFKIARDDWGGRLVSVLDSDCIPDKSILKATLKAVPQVGSKQPSGYPIFEINIICAVFNFCVECSSIECQCNYFTCLCGCATSYPNSNCKNSISRTHSNEVVIFKEHCFLEETNTGCKLVVVAKNN